MPTLSRSEQFTELLSLHQSQLVGYIFALVQDLDDTQDVFQQTSLVLWRKFDAFDGVNFAGWACRTAQLEAMNYLRAKRRGRSGFSEELLVELTQVASRTSEEPLSRLQALRKCVAKLPKSDRELVDLCYGRERAIKPVAQKLGRSAQSVCNSLRRIRRVLLECIDASLAGEG